MVTTRLAPPGAFDGTRHRADPVKLLALIQRIRAASGDMPARPTPKPSVKAG